MEQFKRAQVIMLPTKDKSTLIKGIYNNKLTIIENFNTNHTDFKPQHLYITSDDEIKKNDFYIVNNQVKKCIEIQTHQNFKYCIDKLDNADMITFCKKIIATTDTSLMTTVSIPHIGGQPNRKMLDVIKLPQPSQQFIEKYIESYNKSNIITDVLVEMEIDEEIAGYEHSYLKINPKDNTITIKKLKDSWNREEHSLNLMNCVSELAAQFGHTPTASEMKKWNEATKEWIKENL